MIDEPTAQNGISSHFVTVQQQRMHYLARKGSSRHSPQLILLHGFPENAHAWAPLIQALPAHYHIIAPDLPGYHKSQELSADQDYQVAALVGRIASFIRQVTNDTPVTLVAHDWGGAIAWPLAAFHPQLFNQLFILNAAHPSTFTRALKRNKVQRQKSQYIHDLVHPQAEQQLSATQFALFKDMLGSSMFTADNEYACSLVRDWEDATTLSAMLNYYRQMPQTVPPVDASDQVLAAIKVPNIRITLPTCVLWGRQDKAFDESVLDGLNDYVKALTVRYHDNATHWLHREQPSWVAAHIVSETS